MTVARETTRATTATTATTGSTPAAANRRTTESTTLILLLPLRILQSGSCSIHCIGNCHHTCSVPFPAAWTKLRVVIQHYLRIIVSRLCIGKILSRHLTTVVIGARR
jgi:hypothetical protein